jgi:maltooligosyltrehalose trehalohydrolase
MVFSGQMGPSGMPELSRRLPVGAEVLPGGGVHFRVWAPRRSRVEVVLKGGGAVALAPEGGGYFSSGIPGAGCGALYRFRLDGEEPLCPDPASRFQPAGPHGPSQVIDPAAFEWSDAVWRGLRIEGQVLYELHVGTFTREGTFAAAAEQLPELAALGITAIELMPVAEFAGRFGWGYDGVDLFAPHHFYGVPDDLRRLVDRAHSLGVGVMLDVVYNHAGPEGSYLSRFSPDYFTSAHATEWGDAINFASVPVREFFLANARYWISEFHMDGLRLDATQTIFDGSAEHILAAIGREARRTAEGRSVILVAENEPQDARLVRPLEEGGYGLDAVWNDDFHHSARVALTGRAEAYYTDYAGKPQEFISSVKRGYLYQGQFYRWQKKRRGSPASGIPPAAFVSYLENHDQAANSGGGERLHQLAAPSSLRAMTALLLLAPGTPLLFQGQEFAASSPFAFFADHKPELAAMVEKGRVEFLSQFPSLARPELRARIPAPQNPAVFERAKLDFAERARHAAVYALHRDLLALRRDDPVFRAQRPGAVDGAVLGPEAFLLRYFGEDGDDRLLVVNLGADLRLAIAPEPLLAPPEGMRWEQQWSSEDPRYGGSGAPEIDADGEWRIPGRAAVAMRPVARKAAARG